MKFARNVQFQIKDGKEQEFTSLFERDILPVLRKQTGFKQELMLIANKRAIGISLWDDRRHAETYGTETFPQVLQKLTPLIDGMPRVESYQVGLTTLPA